MTTFAILRFSRGLKGLGDFDTRRSDILGDPEKDEICLLSAAPR
jgi:hypothetical protein